MVLFSVFVFVCVFEKEREREKERESEREERREKTKTQTGTIKKKPQKQTTDTKHEEMNNAHFKKNGFRMNEPVVRVHWLNAFAVQVGVQ